MLKQVIGFGLKNWRKLFPIELFSVLVLAILLIIPTWFYIIKNSASDELSRTRQASKIAVFLELGTSSTIAISITEKISKLKEVTNIEYVSSKKAMEIFKSQSNLGKKLEFLGDKVLPPTLFVEPKDIQKTANIELLISQIKSIPQVDLVILDSYWSGKLAAFLVILNRLATLISWVFVLAFVVMVFFVTKVLLATVLNEIKLKLLLGSTHGKIISHYVIQSIYLGVISAVICLLVTWFGISWLDIPLASFINQFGINFTLNMLTFTESILLILISSLLYACTAWLTCSVVLFQIDNHLEQVDKF